MKRARIAASALSALGMTAALPFATLADEPQMSGASCVPVSGPYKVTAAKVKFKTGKTGTIVLHCPLRLGDLATAITSAFSIVVTYRDSGGPAASGRVKVTLLAIGRGNGTSLTFPQFNSNSQAPASGVTSNFGLPVPAVPKGAYYHMRIELKRANTGQTVEFYGAEYDLPI